MKIAVMGAGALGGYFGGRLAAAGQEVTLIARGAHLAAIRERGLKILSPRGDLHLQRIAATDDPGEVGLVDVVFFMVKNYDVETAAHAIAPLLGPGTMVVTCQNGVSAPDRLAAVIGADRVVPGVARIPGDVPEPGVIRHSAMLDELTFGEAKGGISERCRRLEAALRAAGTTPKPVENIRADLWMKLVMQATLASMCTLLRLDIGPIRDCAATAELFRQSMAETAAVARASVGGIPEDAVEKVWGFVEKLPETVHASMLDDLNRGRRLEVDYLSGDVVRIGSDAGVPTPIHRVFWAALQPFKDGPTP